MSKSICLGLLSAVLASVGFGEIAASSGANDAEKSTLNVCPDTAIASFIAENGIMPNPSTSYIPHESMLASRGGRAPVPITVTDRAVLASVDIPVVVEYEVINMPTTGGQVDFLVNITPHIPLDKAILSFSTTGDVALTSSLDQILIDVMTGSTVSIAGTLDILQAGSGSLTLHVSVFDLSTCGEFVLANDNTSLFILGDGAVVYTGAADILNLQIERVLALLDSGQIDEQEADQFINNLMGIDAIPDTRDEHRSSLGKAVPRADDVTIDVTLQWTDIVGGRQPARFATVRVYALDEYEFREVAQGRSDAAGRFTTTLSPADLPPPGRQIIVKFFAETADPSGQIVAKVTNPALWGLTSPFFEGRPYWATIVNTNVPDGAAIVGSYHTEQGAKDNAAFSIADALIEGAEYVYAMSGTSLDTIDIQYPGIKSAFQSLLSADYIQIASDDWHQWDTILHEYGHYVASEFGFDNSPGGNHYVNENYILSRGKDEGTRLAWSEGLAHYFSIAAQQVADSGSLGIPDVGNTEYGGIDELTGQPVSWSIETWKFGKAEGNEACVARSLWDLADTAADDSDNFMLGHQFIWDKLVAQSGSIETFHNFWISVTNGLSETQLFRFGALSEQNQIAVQVAIPRHEDTASITNPPRFGWLSPVLGQMRVKFFELDSGTGQYIEVYNSDMSTATIQCSGPYPEIAGCTWIASPTDIQAIFDTREDVYWIVEGFNTDPPVTGPYWSGAK